MPTAADIVDVLPVIVSLIVIEGLLSVDNALAIAAMASHLPKHQQLLALRLGLLGAYLFRGLVLFFVSLIIANPWLKFAGAAYLIYLMASHLARTVAHHEAAGASERQRRLPGLWMTVLRIEIMDLSLSLDNVVAAVALDKRLWVVCTGVFIGILALRFLAGYCIQLIARFPVLGKTAFLLIGYVGLILVVEVGCEMAGRHIDVTSVQKFMGIVLIVALSVGYERHRWVRALLTPLVAVGHPLLVGIDRAVGLLFWPLTHIGHRMQRFFLRVRSTPDETLR